MRRGRWCVSVLLAAALAVRAIPTAASDIDWKRVTDDALERLRAYIRINTTNPPGNETAAAQLLREWLATEGIEPRLYDPMTNPDRQALVARLPGHGGRTLVLMSHSDVVPAMASEWRHDPFAAEVVDGTLYGRGTLDTKGLGILQAMTLVLMHRQHLAPRDEILLLIEPDEEEAGQGAKGLLEKYPELFRDVRMVLSEGGPGTFG